jgi:Flp pilus assembly protein TadD
LFVLLAGCGSTPSRTPAPESQSDAPGAATSTGAATANGAAKGNGPGAASPGGAATSGAAPGPVPERAAAQYSQALELMKAGKSTDAELELQQIALAYPEFAGPELNLGLLYLRDSRLPDAEKAFKAALARSPDNAVAANELGIAERKLGKFADAEAAYNQAIASAPDYASAHLNLGVLYDLYLDQPQKALDQFERYLAIAGENKQVAGWVAELHKRVGSTVAVKKDAT